jgi:hypothetical protein
MPMSGYQTAVSSPPFVAYNPAGGSIMITSANGTRFAFDSVIIAPAWRDNLIWSIYTYQAGVQMVSGSFSIMVLNQTIISCGICTGLDTLLFTVSGGTPRSGLAQNGTQFAFDDLCISFGY